jgi:hypothetical protein
MVRTIPMTVCYFIPNGEPSPCHTPMYPTPPSAPLIATIGTASNAVTGAGFRRGTTANPDAWASTCCEVLPSKAGVCLGSKTNASARRRTIMGTRRNSGVDVGANVRRVEPNANDWPNRATYQFGSESI